MSKPERFMVTAIDCVTGEKVKGYYLTNTSGLTKRHTLYEPTDLSTKTAEELSYNYHSIDPATVEPVAVKVRKFASGIEKRACPNCEKFLFCELYEWNYCPNCGQRLDWGN